jgi:hypothetical protein
LFEPPGARRRGGFDVLLEPRRRRATAAAKVPVRLNRKKGIASSISTLPEL